MKKISLKYIFCLAGSFAAILLVIYLSKFQSNQADQECIYSFELDQGSVFQTSQCIWSKNDWETSPHLAEYLRESDRFYMGKIDVEYWPFDMCGLFAKLASHPDWHRDITSKEAQKILEELLVTSALTNQVDDLFEQSGKQISSVELEKLLLVDSYAKCAVEPHKVPEQALMGLNFY